MSAQDRPPRGNFPDPHLGAGVRIAVLALFFLSGACGLVYEVVWMRMLTLTFGATAFATSTILGSFFTGLALGGAYFGRLADRIRRPLRTYALLEGAIGLFAFLMPVLLSAVTAAYVGIERQFEIGYYAVNLVRFALSFAVLVLPATLMGGTLPLVVKFFARSRLRVGRNVGRLYAINTLGAVVGTLAAGFFLILLLGTREAAYAAGLVNLAIAGAALLVSRRVERSDASTDPVPSDGVADGGRPSALYPPRLVRLTLWAIGLSGLCALALEVFWTRSLVFFLDNSTHAFTTILTAFLVGIGLGSLLVSFFIDSRRRLLGWLGLIEILIGVSALLAIPLINQLTPVFERMGDVALDASLGWRWVLARFANALSIVLLPTLLMGMSFPIAVKICAGSVDRLGRSLGDVYAINTVGGVVGSLLAGFAMIPLLGVRAGIVVVASLNALLGLVLVFAEPGQRRAVKLSAAASVAVFLGVGGVTQLRGGGLTLTSHYEGLETDEILFYEEGIGATVKVYRDVYGDRILSINGFPVAGEPPEYQDAQKGLAHFPLLLTSVPSPRVGIVGFGAGGTSWSVLQHDVASVTTVELVPAVPRAAGFFPEVNHGVLDEPRFNLVLGDGRNHMLVSDEVYDVISIDATSPKMAGNGSLYSRDFYELLLRRSSEEGIVVQWIPHHLLSDVDVRMTVRSFMAVFPHSTLWFSPLRQNMVLIGTRDPFRLDWRELRRKFENERMLVDLENVNIETPLDFLSGFVMGEDALAAYVEGVGENTDNHPVLEFTPAMAYFVGDMYRLRNLLDFRENREPVLPWIVNLGETEEETTTARAAIERRYEAVGHSVDGDVFLFLGERRRAIEAYDRALRIDPEEKNWLNTVGPFAEGR